MTHADLLAISKKVVLHFEDFSQAGVRKKLPVCRHIAKPTNPRLCFSHCRGK